MNTSRAQAESCVRRGENCFASGELRAAQEAFRQAIAFDSTYAEAYNDLGVLLWQVGEVEQACTFFQQACLLETTNEEYIANFCDAMNSLGLHELASRFLLGLSPEPVLSERPHFKYSFGMIVLNGDDFIEYALRSIYDFAYEIIIVEGAVEEATFMVGPDGGSRDKTLTIIEEFPDPENKITLIRGRWKDKTEQSNVYMRLATGDYVWQLDSDEVYRREDLFRADALLHRFSGRFDMVSFYCHHFFHDFWTIGRGGRWDAPEDPFRRIFKREDGCFFSTHWPPTVVYPNDPARVRGHLHAAALQDIGIQLYHYSYVTPKQVQEKIEYYARKNYSQAVGTDLFTWYERVWSQWTHPGCEAEQRFGSHPNTRRPTWTEHFLGEHPDVMNSHPLFLKGRGARELLEGAPKRIGSEYGGWWTIPAFLREDSVVYSFGIGEDLSFDLALAEQCKATIHAFDPSPRSLNWVRKQVLPDTIRVHEWGLSDVDGQETFFPPEHEEHVSFSAIGRNHSCDGAVQVPVLCLNTIAERLGHTRIHLLKMDIEGAEYKVVQSILDSKVPIDQILIEFHHDIYPSLKMADTHTAVEALSQAGYELFRIEGHNYSFIRKDLLRIAYRSSLEYHNLEGRAETGCYWRVLRDLIGDLPTPEQGRRVVCNIGGRADSAEWYLGPRSGWQHPIDYRTIDINPSHQPDICADIHDLSAIPDGTADLVLCTEVIMYSPEPARAFAEMARILRSGGAVLCITPMLYPRAEQPNSFYRDCTRMFASEIIDSPLIDERLAYFSKCYGVEVSKKNVKDVMRLDEQGHIQYEVYDLDSTRAFFRTCTVFPAYDSPKDGTIQLVIWAIKE